MQWEVPGVISIDSVEVIKESRNQRQLYIHKQVRFSRFLVIYVLFSATCSNGGFITWKCPITDKTYSISNAD